MLVHFNWQQAKIGFKISFTVFGNDLEVDLMFITTLNTGFKLFIVDINFYGTFEQVSTKVCVVSILSTIKIKVLVYSTDF